MAPSRSSLVAFSFLAFFVSWALLPTPFVVLASKSDSARQAVTVPAASSPTRPFTPPDRVSSCTPQSANKLPSEPLPGGCRPAKRILLRWTKEDNLQDLSTAVPATRTLSSQQYLSQYEFSPLAIPEQAGSGGGILGEWLPDSKRITQLGLNNDHNSTYGYHMQTWDSHTGVTDPFGSIRYTFLPHPPFWLSDVDRMGFIGAINDFSFLLSGAPDLNLWITQSGTQTLTVPALSNIVDAAGRGSTVIALTSQPRQLVEYDALTKEARVLPVDVSDIGSSSEDGYITMKWHPSLPLVAISAPGTFSVYNVDTETLRRLPLGPPSPAGLFDTIPTALQYAWNPMQPSLAVIVGTADYRLVGGAILQFLDAESGLLTSPPQTGYQIYNMVWAPNGRDLLAFAHDEDWYAPFQPQFVLIDTVTWEHIEIDALVESVDENTQVFAAAWSPDGSRIVLNFGDKTHVISVTIPAPSLRK